MEFFFLCSVGKSFQMEKDPASSLVWVRDKKDVWRVAKIVSATDTDVVVEGKDGSHETFSGADHAIFDQTHNLPLPDLSQYNNLHEAPLLYGLKKRLANDSIYTHCGEILVSVNPYKEIPNLYTLEESAATAEEGGESDDEGEDDVPHVYHVAKKALRDLSSARRNQSVVISGESGAGKTEASKHVMRYLIKESSKVQSCTVELGSNIQKSLMKSNVILEAFGNAKTVRNDNSSRFGKYIKLKYSPSLSIVGAKTDHFLLEKSRLISVAKGERNYHIFYQMLAGTRDVGAPSDFKMLNGGKTLKIGGVDDKEEFEHTCEAMETVGIDSDVRSSLWEVLMGLLKLGNVDFVLKEPENPEKGSAPADSAAMAAISSLLGLENNEFVLRLTEKRSVSGRGSITAVPLDDRQASDNSRALIKYVYGCMFEWLVGKINRSHAISEETSSENCKFVGILDIFGFEIFKSNSFEQLCINFANEILQQQFNHQVFVLEKQAYEAEGIDSSVIQFQDNQPVIDLISKKPKGLMPVLEEHCLMSRDPDNQALLSTYNRNQASHANFAKPRFGNESFVVKHFAGDVEYQVKNFVEKNNDSMTDELLDLVKFSSKEVLKEIMSVGSADGDDDDSEDDGCDDDPDLPPTAPRRSTIATGRRTTKQGNQGFAALNTVSYTFRLQLDSLASTLRATSPHYIKCIKPNSAKAPGGFNNALVIEQLRYSGVLEVVRIRREGFPTRVPFDEFHKKYAILLKNTTYDKNDDRAAALLICEKSLAEGQYQEGKSCLFLRDMMLRELSLAVKMFYSSQATMIVARFRSMVAKRKYKKARDSASQLEAFARMLRKKKEFKKEKELMIKIQSHVRGRLERVGYGKKLRTETAAATKIASARRMMLEHQEYLKAIDSVTKIEAKFRQHKAEADFRDEKKKAIAVQAAIRAHQAQKEKVAKLVSIARLQVGIRAFLRNCRLSSKVLDFHTGARNKEVEVVKKMLANDPSLGILRNRYDHMKTILHTACKAGHFEIVKLLDPSYEDVFAVDSLGNCALHYAAGSARVQIVKYLAGIVNTAALLDVKDHKVGLKKALRRLKSQKSNVGSEGDAAASKENEVLVEGWLKKHKVGKSTGNRWCTLSRTELKYFKRKSDKNPAQNISLEVAMVKYCLTEKHTFEIHSPLLLDAKRNPHGRMYFVCETEVVLQKWLAALRVSDAMTEMLVTKASNNPSSKKDIINLEARRAFVGQKNGQGQTALHVLAKADKTKWRQSDSEGKVPAGAGARRRLSTAHVLKRQQTTFGGASSVVRVADVATFLLESGCNIDSTDVDGNTAIRLAVENKLDDLVFALVKKGADINIKGSDGRSAKDCMSTAALNAVADMSGMSIEDLPELKGEPAKVAGGTYMSFRFEKLSIMDLAEECDPYVKITVYVKTAGGGAEVAEEPQAITRPVHVCNEFVYVGYTFNLQSALEDIKNGLAVVELCDKKKSGEVVSWCLIDLAIGSDEVNSGEVHFDMHEGPVNLKNDADYVSADMVLSGDIVLTKLE